MPKIVDHEQRRQAIIDVAKKLIIEGGFEAATMRSIVAEAGFANGALKHYFANKDSIIAATFQHVLTEMNEQIVEPSRTGEPEELLRQYVEAALPLDEYRIASARVLLALWEHSVSNEELAGLYREHLRSWRGQLATIIAKARNKGESADDPAVTGLAGDVIGASVGAHVTCVMFPDGSLIPEYRAFVDRFMRHVHD